MNKKRNYFFLSHIIFCSALIGISTPYAFSEPLFRTSSDYDHVLVEEVLTTDTIVLEGGEKIHLIGLKAPEPPKKGKKLKTDKYHIIVREADPTISTLERAFQFVVELLKNKYIRLEFDAQRRDERFYTDAYAFLPDGTFVNEEILRQGYAQLRIVTPNTKYADQLRQAYQEARREKRGLQGE